MGLQASLNAPAVNEKGAPLGAPGERLPWIRPVVAGMYLLAFWNLVCVTLLGLHYLMDRVHRADPVIISKGSDKAVADPEPDE